MAHAINIGMGSWVLASLQLVLPSIVKVYLLRRLGYTIGRNARISFASAVVGRKVRIADNAEVRVGSLMFAHELTIGKGSVISSSVWAYGEGALTIGRQVYIGPRTILNVAADVTIGDEVTIGAACKVYTHAVFMPYSRGYPRIFEPVDVGSRSFVGASTFIAPGSTVGEDCIVGGGSAIYSTVPEKTFAAGVPAKPITAIQFTDAVEAEGMRFKGPWKGFCFVPPKDNDIAHVLDTTFREIAHLYDDADFFAPNHALLTKRGLFRRTRALLINGASPPEGVEAREAICFFWDDEPETDVVGWSWFNFATGECQIRTPFAATIDGQLTAYFGEHFSRKTD